MSEGRDETHRKIDRARFTLVFLFFLGLVVILWGFAGPVATGAAFAEVVVEQLGLPKEPKTYTKLAMLYAEQDARKGVIAAILGLLILLPATIGLWVTGGATYKPHDRL